MKKSRLTSALLLVLVISAFSTPVLAAITVESAINQDVYVTLDFDGIDPQTYAEIEANTQFNATTIPQIITRNLAQKNLKRVWLGYARVDKNSTELSVRVAFHLGGSDIISFTVNKTSMMRAYRVSTEWRKFRVDLAEGFSLDFAQYFGTPLSQWQRTNRTDALGIHPTYYRRYSPGFLLISFYFILPTTATNVQVAEDLITYEVPPYTEDVFLNSPFLILAVLMVISLVIVVYRKTKS